MNDLGKKDILRFGIVGLSSVLLSGSLESLRDACIEVCCCVVKRKAGAEERGSVFIFVGGFLLISGTCQKSDHQKILA
jgi:hypothetical protein